MRNPIQPLLKDENGAARFKENEIVRYLLDSHPKVGMNDIACMDFSDDDRRQFAQLIGYTLAGYGELSYVDDDSYAAACLMSGGMTEEQSRVACLQEELDALRKSLRDPVAMLFGVHPDDLGR